MERAGGMAIPQRSAWLISFCAMKEEKKSNTQVALRFVFE